MEQLSNILLFDPLQYGNKTDILTYICYQEIKAELISEVVSYILHIAIFGLLFIWIMFKTVIYPIGVTENP